MKTEILWHQGAGISRDEWRLQRRNWGTWLAGLFFLAVVVGEHPALGIAEFSITEAAGNWADKVIIVGSMVAMLTIPFALDRVRRQRVAPIEISKPFEKSTYVIGKFMGAGLPLAFVTLLSLGVHFAITLASLQGTSFLSAGISYLNQVFLIALVPLVYAASLTYCLSVYIRQPLLIMPLYLFYLIITTVSQAAADAKFSWWSPMVRPDYFSYAIPAELTPAILAHQGLYLLLSAVALGLAVYGFQRNKFTDGQNSLRWWRRIRFPLPAQLGVRMRMLWGGPMVAALIMAAFSIANTLSNPSTDPIWRAEYALFGLEFYLAVTGLLILAGVVARDKSIGALDLVLSKPVNRWRLLRERLFPALTFYFLICVITTLLFRIAYEQLPIPKALLVSFSTGMYLGLIGMTAANVAQNELAGYGAGLIYWLFEAGFDGRFTAPFFLFIVSSQVDHPATAIWQSPAIWLPVKAGLLLLSLWLFLINGWLLEAGPGRRRAFTALIISFPVIFILGWWLMPIFV